MVTTFNDLHLAAHNREHVRKAQRSLAFIGRKRDVERIDFNEYGPSELPDFEQMGYKPVGNVTTDGFSFGREEDSEEVESHGFTQAVRIDTEKVTRNVSTTVQATQSRLIREIADGTDYSSVTIGENGFLVLDENEMPEHDEWSLIVIFRDGPESDRFIFGRQFHTVKLESAGDEGHGGGEEINQELTWRVFADDETGIPVTKFYGGPGFQRLAESLGWAEGN